MSEHHERQFRNGTPTPPTESADRDRRSTDSSAGNGPASPAIRPISKSTTPEVIFPLTPEEILTPREDSAIVLTNPPSSVRLGAEPVPIEGPLQSSAVDLLAPLPSDRSSVPPDSLSNQPTPLANGLGQASHIFANLRQAAMAANPGEISAVRNQASGTVEDEQLSFTRSASSRSASHSKDSGGSILDIDVGDGPEARPTVEFVPLNARLGHSRARWLSWLCGGLVWAVVGAGVSAGAWYFGLLPERSRKSVAPAVQPEDRVSAGLTKLAAGDFSEAARDLDTGVSQHVPAAVAGQARARWLIYLTDCARQNQRPQSAHTIVQRARKELQTALSGDYRAALWLGVMEEEVGNWKAAARAYEEGKAAHPTHQRLFDSALERLAAQQPDGPGGSAARGPTAADALLLEIALLWPDPEGSVPGTEEPGFDFWSAVRAAQRQDYPTALSFLQRARAAHENYRLEHPGRGLNKESDPREEIFLRCCDELRGSWEVRQQLKDAGLDLPALGSIAPTLARVLSERKEVEGQLTAARTQAERAVREREIAAKESTKANAELAQLRAAANALKQDRQASAAALKEAEERSRQAGTRLAQAETVLDRIAHTLKEAGRLDPQAGRDAVPVAVARLVSVPADNSELARRFAAQQDELVRLRRQLADRASAPSTRPAPPSDPTAALVNLAEAIRQYDVGLSAFRAGRLDEAEAHFAAAVRRDGRDARYRYYLGLTRYRLGRTADAEDEFRRAADLEREDLPGPREVNASLERVQGDLRAVLSSFRP